MRVIVGVIAGACCALVIACAPGGRPRNATAPAPTSAEAAPGMPQDPHSQIERLDQEITEARTKLGLPEVAPVASCTGPNCPSVAIPMAATSDPTCHPATNDTCTNTCTLSDSICGNATKICDLAKQMQGDTWAADHCTSATTSCQTAHVRCCGCQ